jgi:uncharacterized protein (TIGR00369 family)
MAVELELVKKLCKLMITANKGDHFHQLNMQFVAVERGLVRMKLPYSESIVGNPDTGVVYGGALTALLDTCCGMASCSVLDDLVLTPTMDLRIDYMGSAEPGKAIYAEAEVYRSSSSVIFTRGKAYQEDPRRPLAHCVANFFRLTGETAEQISNTFKPFLDTVEVDQWPV